MSVIPKYQFKADDIVKQGRTSKENIEAVKKWTAANPRMPPVSEEQVALFLLACKDNVEFTEETMETYFRQRYSAPEIFQDRDIDGKEGQFTHSVTKLAVFPKRTKENYAIAMAGIKDTSYYNFNIESQVKAAFALIDVLLYSNPPDGLIFIIDIKGVGIMHLTRLKLGTLKKFFAYVQEALPTQLKRVHIINASYIFEKILAIAKPFMKKELFELIIAHPPGMPWSELHEQYIPASLLPSDLGGELPSVEQLHEGLQREMKKLKAFLEAHDKQALMYKK
ncbi:unnamed protein product [Acanthoscelides obtectus]|nr:unnamed protein product [Acanthoscelides obtectus]CAK1661426.1 Retinaldehyde-binding protein 1 [Acanthoscelides obtectus]